MPNYILTTHATMKPYNNNKWWIDSDTIKPFRISAENVETALKLYRDNVHNQDCVEISNHALKNKYPMYVDTSTGVTRQIGYVITGKMEFEDRDNYKWSKQYIDLWVDIETAIDTVF